MDENKMKKIKKLFKEMLEAVQLVDSLEKNGYKGFMKTIMALGAVEVTELLQEELIVNAEMYTPKAFNFTDTLLKECSVEYMDECFANMDDFKRTAKRILEDI